MRRGKERGATEKVTGQGRKKKEEDKKKIEGGKEPGRKDTWRWRGGLVKVLLL